jgi:hypothetical protein
MESGRKRIGYPEWLILVGGSVFVAVLALSAYWEKDIRWLHFFQAWMYIATMALVIVGSPWGHFIGVSAAAFWDYSTIFGTTFFFNGLEQLSIWVRTGHLARPDILIAVPAWIANLFGGCRVSLVVFSTAGKSVERHRKISRHTYFDHWLFRHCLPGRRAF